MRFVTLTSPAPCRFTAFAGSLLVACAALSGCASSRLLKAPTPTKAPDLGLAATAPDGLMIEVHQFILPNGGGSWIRNASWDEYVLTVKNDSQIPIEIQRFDVYSAKVAAPVQSSTSQEQLAVQTSRVHQDLKDLGLVGGTSLGSAGLASGVAATTMGAGGFVSAAAVAAIVVFPVALIGGTSYVVSRRNRTREDKVLIDRTLMERGLGVPVEIAPGTPLRKSVFFPITPAPTRLVVHYEVSGESRVLSLPLPASTGLNLAAKIK